ncbi:MAG: DUF1284 domain-containing protein [Bacillota bacterium]|nr:MAG: DUF1284 domain-containing protein [Bacillota bacterium]
MIRLRGHHLVCLHFYQGDGYPAEYLDDMKKVIGRVNEAEKIRVVWGPDDVCASCPYLSEGRCGYQDGMDEEIKELDLKALELLKVDPGEEVNWREIKEKVASASRDWFLSFCKGCVWERHCNRP